MTARPVDLPDFRQPPLSEVVLSLQFDPLDRLKTPLIGILWNRFRERLPEIEEHPPLPQVVERFDGPVPAKVDVVIELAAVLRQWSNLPSGGFLPQAEDVAVRSRYIIPDEAGK